jgi:XTP/dITP diphosphohydrolase
MQKIGPKLVLASHNVGKLEEIGALLAPFGVETLSIAAWGQPEPEETEDTFVGNARIKAHAAAAITGLPALSDDSGICVDALGGMPGVYTADWAESSGGRDFLLAMTRTWEACEKLDAPLPRRAQFRCTLVVAWPDGTDLVFEGRVEGCLVWPIRGDNGHGYDPMFQADGRGLTFGEMDRWEKNRISHRADAFAKLVADCFT